MKASSALLNILKTAKDLILDFDGTCVDIRYRIHGLYAHLLPGGVLPLHFERFWRLKRDCVGYRDLLRMQGLSSEQQKKFQQHWMRQIESSEWVNQDRLFPFTRPALKVLSRFVRLHLITARRRPKIFFEELEKLRLRSFFTTIVVVGDSQTKKKALRKIRGLQLEKAVLAGDTEADIRAGRSLGITTIAVLSGSRNKKMLKKCKPDFIIPHIGKLTEVISHEPFHQYQHRRL